MIDPDQVSSWDAPQENVQNPQRLKGNARARTSGTSSASARPAPAAPASTGLDAAHYYNLIDWCARACSFPVPLSLGPELTMHACGIKLSRPLPSGAAATGHAWPRTPIARMLLLARAAAHRPYQSGIRRERAMSMDTASCSCLLPRSWYFCAPCLWSRPWRSKDAGERRLGTGHGRPWRSKD
jgi:hypothetical protein